VSSSGDMNGLGDIFDNAPVSYCDVRRSWRTWCFAHRTYMLFVPDGILEIFVIHHGARQHTERIQIQLLGGEARGRARARSGGTHVPDAKRCCHTVWDQSQYYLRSDQGGEYLVYTTHL